MFLYTVISAAVAVIAGILLAVCTKKTSDVIYTKLDKAGRITNILLIPVYICPAPLYMFVAMIARPQYDGFLGILGWIVAGIMGAAPLFCGLGLGFSVALRKKGRSKLSFALQFAGVLGIAINLILFFIFYGNLLMPLNCSGVSSFSFGHYERETAGGIHAFSSLFAGVADVRPANPLHRNCFPHPIRHLTPESESYPETYFDFPADMPKKQCKSNRSGRIFLPLFCM